MSETLNTIQSWINHSQNKINVVKRSNALNGCKSVLNVSENSFLGAVIDATGGLIFDNYIRHFGGENEFGLTIQSINKIIDYRPTVISNMLIIAVDIFGGIFSIDCGAFSKDNLGKVCYLPPDSYSWEFMNFSHSAFLEWCIRGDLQAFYLPILERVNNMKLDNLQFDRIWSFSPDLWSENSEVSCDEPVDCKKMIKIRLEMLSLISHHE